MAEATEEHLDEVRSGARNVVTALAETWPPLDPRWYPVTEASIAAELFDGRITLRGKPDLTLGRAEGTTAGKVIVDFKTGGTSIDHVADLRFYALIDALRLGVPPRLLCSAYLDSATLHTEAVTEELLEATLWRTVDAAAAIVELRDDAREPRRSPSVACRWCTLLTDCEQGRAFLADEPDD
ncbi:MAG: PD-(D/E)XK nuclease family protein [Microthrixaceae bacterium]